MELTPKSSEYETVLIKDGLHNAEFKEVRTVKDGEHGPRVAMIFDVYHSEEEKPVELAYVCYKIVSEKSNLGKAFMALGAKFEDGVPFKTEAFYGRLCKVYVKKYTKDNTEQSGINEVNPGDEETGPFIEKVKASLREPAKEAAPQEPKPAEPAPAPTPTEKVD